MKPKRNNGFIKISEEKARTMLRSSDTRVYICASKMTPQMWDEYLQQMEKKDFDIQVAEYKEKKCSYKTGLFPSFFVKAKKQRI